MSAEAAAIPAAARLRITETFLSLQGEADAVGWPTFFIRLTGCPLRCRYCDTAYAFEGGEWRTLAALLDAARASGVRHVCVTGGEPLAQKPCRALLVALCDAGFHVSLETSGAIDAGDVDARVLRVIDVKTPGSGESRRNLDLSRQKLRPTDQLKFVICDRADYEWARDRVRAEGLDRRCPVLFSPSWQELPARELADWILADRLPVRFQLQLHKVLWGDVPGR
ncbi:MAG: 7-carboxy-7-deazaguanine synthase QueE [Gammaproteobacteria bacterium]